MSKKDQSIILASLEIWLFCGLMAHAQSMSKAKQGNTRNSPGKK